MTERKPEFVKELERARPDWKLCRPLLRGVRVEILSGTPTTKVPIKNRMTMDILTGMPQFVGEIVVGLPEDPECRQITELFLDQEDLMHPFILWVYDLRTTEIRSLDKRLELANWLAGTCPPLVQYVDHKEVNSKKELEEYARLVIGERKFPGIVLREPWGTFGHEDETLTEIPSFQ